MTLEQLIDIEDALDCQRKMSRTDFLSTCKQTPAILARNSAAWDEAISLITQLGTWQRAWNDVQRRIGSFHLNDSRI